MELSISLKCVMSTVLVIIKRLISGFIDLFPLFGTNDNNYQDNASKKRCLLEYSFFFSDYGMYYYYCEDTGESTWSYPVGRGSKDKMHASQVTYGPAYQATEGTETLSAPIPAPSDNYGYGRSNIMMWQSDLGRYYFRQLVTIYCFCCNFL